jgi:hypothetical protein
LGEVGDYHIGAVAQQRDGVPTPVDTDDPPEPASVAGFDARVGIFNDRAVRRRNA